MVHALKEIHRVLTPGGWLADLRPNRRLEGRRRRDVLATLFGLRGRREIPVGVLEEGSFADDEAADRAVRRALREGLFTLLSTETFPFRFYFRTLALLDDHLGTRSTAFLEAPTRRRLEALMRGGSSRGILSVETLLLNVLRKV
ncbi:MAG: hypothetical protein HY334_01340 [Armatimonadetes bacterium]|nr:hypothetical protein [Armatimonadota bacterium]